MGMKIISAKEFFSNISDQDTEDLEVDQDEYSVWLTTGKEYSPAIKLKVKKSLPGGVYRMAEDPRTGEVYITPNQINTDDLYTFSDSMTEKILKEVEDFWAREDVYKKYNFVHKRGILLVGPAGNSKTSTINLLIQQLVEKKDAIIFLVNNIKDFVVISQGLSNIVRKIEPHRPIITIIEDIDQLLHLLGSDADLLDFLDGKKSIDNHLVIMTSNDTSELSSALLRPSRVDMQFILESPNEEIRKEFFQKKGISEDQLDSYNKKTEGMSFAQLKEVFISTCILGKDLDTTVAQILNPLETKNYLIKTDNKIGL